jgi:formiminotetrahydrofolate cyclodeaminase
MLTSLTITDFLNETASNSPAPGGGSVSALAASLGAALNSMVCRLTIGKKKYADVQTEMEELLRKSEELRVKLTNIIDEDTAAFNKVMAAFGLPKETEEEKKQRSAANQEATKAATLVPLKLMELCGDAIELTRTVAKNGNQNSLSDAGVAALMLQAGCEGAALNVKINLFSLSDTDFVIRTKSQVDQILTAIHNSSSEVIDRINKSLQ